MKRHLPLILILLSPFYCLPALGQHYYPEIVSYNGGNVPVNGIKIKTNMPYAHGVQMPTVFIQGYNYGTSEPIDLKLVWYVYDGNFIHQAVSSAGAYTPGIKLSNENGKVVIYMSGGGYPYFQRFMISAFAYKNELPGWFTGWTVVDEPLTGTNTVTVPYKNAMSGTIELPGGIWNSSGNVGIGTTNTHGDRLAVNGKVRAKEVKVEAVNWPDYVFESGYDLMALNELRAYVQANGHLPDIPGAERIHRQGVNLGEISAKLLRKIEELTLYLLEKDAQVRQLEARLSRLEEQLTLFESTSGDTAKVTP